MSLSAVFLSGLPHMSLTLLAERLRRLESHGGDRARGTGGPSNNVAPSDRDYPSKHEGVRDQDSVVSGQRRLTQVPIDATAASGHLLKCSRRR
jgi:hypothetical protein